MSGCLGGGDPPCEKAVNTVQRANLRGVDVKGRPERRGLWPLLLGRSYGKGGGEPQWRGCAVKTDESGTKSDV